MATYYKTIKGVRYDKEMLDTAEESVKGKKNGKLSINDSRKIIEQALDGPGITDVEAITLQYIYDNYDFTPAAKKHFAEYLTDDTVAKTAVVKEEELPSVSDEVKESDEIEESNIVEETATEVKGFFTKYYLLIILIALVLFLFYLYFDRLTGCMSKDGQPIEDANNAVKIEKLEDVSDKPAEVSEAIASQESMGNVAGENEYIIKAKDTLYSISNKIYGNPDKWKELYEKNKDVIEDPSMIFPGQKIKTDIK